MPFSDGTGRVVLSVERVGDQIELAVADDGVGMTEKDAGAIPEKRGSDYVKIFVRQLGGTIVPSVAEETGTTVRIRLPFPVGPGRRRRARSGVATKPVGPTAIDQVFEGDQP